MSETGYPCSYCGVNSWTSCRHRIAEGEKSEVLKEKPNLYVSNSGGGRYKIHSTRHGNGYNFRRKKSAR